MNLVARRRPPLFWARLPADSGGGMFRCDLRDPLMREACLTGRYEPQETALMHRLLKPGMTFVDVGANWGYFTLAAAHRVGASGRIVSVEADPRACDTLRANVAANELHQVTVVATAASDTIGMLAFRPYGAFSDMHANFGVALAKESAAGARYAIPSRPLDDVLDEVHVDRVDLMKMDIEGAEWRALGGLRRRLESGRVLRIILELHPAYLAEQGVSPATVITRLKRARFEAWRIAHSPETHRRAAVGGQDVSWLLSPLRDDEPLGDWPHVLFVRSGLAPLGV
jgi:FkbM family methyltransferase